MILSFVKSINVMVDDVVYFGSWSVLWLYNAYFLNIEKTKKKKNHLGITGKMRKGNNEFIQ